MAIIRRRGKRGTTYKVIVHRPGHTQATRTFKTLGEARDWEAQVRLNKQAGGRRTTVREYFDKWLAVVESSSRRPRTVSLYKNAAQRVMRDLGDRRLVDTGPEDWQLHLNGLPLGQRTVNRHAGIVSAALNQARRWGYIPANPMRDVDRPPDPGPTYEVLDEEMTRLFLAEAKRSSMYPALYFLMVTSGLRIGEILDLEWPQVNLLLGEVSVKQGKTQAAIRTIPVPEQVIEAIKALPRLEDRVFPYTYWQVRDDFKRVTTKIGRPKLRMHDLRHTMATLLASKGVHPTIVQKRLGHKHVTTTLAMYSHVLPSMQEEALQKITKIVAEPQ